MEIGLQTNEELELASRLSESALRWFCKNGRVFPWRNTRDPYSVLVAEVCLQKTNADKVALVFEKIIERYPSVLALAETNAENLGEYFAQLGLFKRGEFLVNIARTIMREHGGIVPRDRESLVRIKGIGDYTANSVLCLAYGDRLPLLDRSTQRVLARVFNKRIKKPAWADKEMRQFMQAVLPNDGAREFNLALIDIAAKYCRPTKPQSEQCPFANFCLNAIMKGGATMARGPGIKRIASGFTRRLTPSELKRGYVFISIHKSLPKILDTQDFDLEIKSQVLPNRRIDGSGRILGLLDFLRGTKPEQLWSFQLASRSKLKLTPVK